MSVRSLARRVAYSFGATALIRRRYRRTLRICMYHRFAAPLYLEEHCRHLRKHYHPLPLSTAVHALRTGAQLPEHAVAITVDDGYRDFLVVGHPIFQRYDLPVTVYLATGLLNQQTWLWLDQVRYLFEHTPRQHVQLPFVSQPALHLDLTTARARLEAGEAAKETMKRVPNAERVTIWERLPSLLEVTLPADPPPPYRPLRWPEVKELLGLGVEFGAHTVNHPILARVETAEEVRQEVLESKKQIERETGAECLHFCYPNGKWADFDERAVEAARQGGFQSSVTSVRGVNRPGTADLFRLRRIGAVPESDVAEFAKDVAGFRA